MDSKTNTEGGVELAEGDKPDVSDTIERDKLAKNIHQRLFEAHRIVGRVDKLDTATIKKDGRVVGSYDYHSHDTVVARAKEALIEVGVLAWPTMLEMTQNSNRTRVDAKVTFINMGNPADAISTISFAYGCDNQDKGPGKAYSYAVKNALLKALMINTGEDIEANSVDFDNGSSSRVIEAEQEAEKVMQAWATTFKAALVNAQSIEVIKALEKDNKSRLASPNMPAVTRSFFIDLIQKRKGDLS